MNECPKHWDAMKAKITSLGLDHLIHPDGKQHFEHVKATVAAMEKGEELPPEPPFDPLMSMSQGIFGRMMNSYGMALFTADPATGNPWCPLCLLRKSFDHHHGKPGGRCGDPQCTIEVKPDEKPWDEDWIESCGNAQLSFAKEKGLVKLQ